MDDDVEHVTISCGVFDTDERTRKNNWRQTTVRIIRMVDGGVQEQWLLRTASLPSLPGLTRQSMRPLHNDSRKDFTLRLIMDARLKP